MGYAFATVSIPGNPNEKVAAVAAARFDGIEIIEQDFIADTAGPVRVGRRIRDTGLDIMLCQPFRDVEGLPTHLRARGCERAARTFDLMGALGCGLVPVFPSEHPRSFGGIDWRPTISPNLASAPARGG